MPGTPLDPHPSPDGPASRPARPGRTLDGLRILTVEDDRSVAEMIATLLGMQGADVSVAASAAEARALLGERQFDVVTLDLLLPGESGVELWRYLREAHAGLASRTVFFTGDLSSPAQEFLESTGRPVLTKPCTSAALRSAIQDVLASPPAG